MTGRAARLVVPAGAAGRGIEIVPGPVLLRDPLPRAGIRAHRAVWPVRDPPPSAARLAAGLRAAGILGRGGGGFPFHRKVEAARAAGRPPVVVVNAAESDPSSAKDAALLLTDPHLVLDGAAVVASALDATQVHIVVGRSRGAAHAAAQLAVAERRGGPIAWSVTRTGHGLLGGQSTAVLELQAGRPNRPVTRWQHATSGPPGRRPTLISNAETFAQAAVAWLAPEAFEELGTDEEPGTSLVTVGGDGLVDDGPAALVEIEHGTALAELLADRAARASAAWPGAGALVGGFHGSWVSAREMDTAWLGRAGFAGHHPLGPGVVLPLRPGRCPVVATARVVDHLAAGRAGQCGPCDSGLPALAATARALAAGGGGATAAADRLYRLAGLVAGRGACAHPDGAARVAVSLLQAFPAEVVAHGGGGCDLGDPQQAAIR